MVRKSETISASLSGASDLRYRGAPNVTSLQASGASNISKISEPG